MSRKGNAPVAIALFDRVEEYADALQERLEASDEDEEDDFAVTSDDAIMVFCENFFAQFFRNTLSLRITSFDQQAKMRAAKKRLGLPAAQRETRRLIAQFEKLCDLWPDLQGRGYAASRFHQTEFHVSFLPKLLTRIEAWAKKSGHDQIAERANEVAEYYADIAEGFPDE